MREWVQTGGIQELNGWRERSWAQSEGDRGGGGGEVLRREGGRDGARDVGVAFIYLFSYLAQLQPEDEAGSRNGPDDAGRGLHPGSGSTFPSVDAKPVPPTRARPRAHTTFYDAVVLVF